MPRLTGDRLLAEVEALRGALAKEAARRRLFQEFSRADAQTTTRRFGGNAPSPAVPAG